MGDGQGKARPASEVAGVRVGEAAAIDVAERGWIRRHPTLLPRPTARCRLAWEPWRPRCRASIQHARGWSVECGGALDLVVGGLGGAASTLGLACTAVWGSPDPAAVQMRGGAVQLVRWLPGSGRRADRGGDWTGTGRQGR